VATVLIGVNDLVEDADQLEYRSKLRQIYAEIAQYVKPAMVAAISIPDFSIAPAAARFGSPDDLRSRVEAFNAVASQEAASAGFRYVDLVAASRSEPSRAGWFASDQLHPGDGQYAAWTAWIWECLKDLWPAVARGR
jgi:lysophospholipase L1-like esterase